MIYYLSVSEKEERLINLSNVREAFRINNTIGYTYRDGTTSSANMSSEEDAIAAFKQLDIEMKNLKWESN